jgi:hypothetical protein
MSTTIVDFVSTHPYWPLRFLLVYLGNPILFVSYFGQMSDNTSEDGIRIFGVKTFTTVSTNVSKLNFAMYVLITLPPYLMWFWAQIRIIVPFVCFLFGSTHALNVDTFCARQAGVGACLAAIPGLLNMLVWSTEGMEGNIMGFIFALPLLIAAIFYVVLWIDGVCASLEHQVQPEVAAAAGYHAMYGSGGASSMDLSVT